MIWQQVFSSIILTHLGRIVIDKIIKAIVGSGPVISHHASELMQRNVLDLRETGSQLLESQWIYIFHLGRIVNKAPLQGRSHQPMGLRNGPGSKVAQINGKAGIYGVIKSIYRRADQIESNFETQFVLNNLWLTGGNREIVGIAMASVTSQQTEHIGLGGLLESGKGIIGKDIPLQEVIQLNYRRRCDGDRCWGQGKLHRQAIAEIGNSSANSIVCWRHRRRFVIG